jgi:integrase
MSERITSESPVNANPNPEPQAETPSVQQQADAAAEQAAQGEAEQREQAEQTRQQAVKAFRQPLTLNGVSQRIIRLAQMAGVRLTMHSLRKGFGCYYAGKVSAQVLQRLMRHGDIKTTLTYYANVGDAAEAAVAQRNSPRNTKSIAPRGTSEADDVTPCQS